MESISRFVSLVLEVHPVVAETDQDPAAEPAGRSAANAATAEDEQQLAGVVDLVRAVTAGLNVLLKQGQQLFVQLVVEEQEDRLADPFTIHSASSSLSLTAPPKPAILLL